MPSRRSKSPAAREAALRELAEEIARFHARLPWRKFTDNQPTDSTILVRWENGFVGGAHLNSRSGEWLPRDPGGTGKMIEWAILPPAHRC